MVRQQFTGKERDAETGLDYFGARYLSSAQGRFTSPDSAADEVLAVPLPYTDLQNPQSLNLYAYVQNNPLRFTDVDGNDYHVCVDNGSGGQNCRDLTDDQYSKLYNQQNGTQGINLPGGLGGAITCGGSACGSASYFEPSLQDPTPGIVVGMMAGEAAVSVVARVGGLAANLTGRIAGDAASTTGGVVASGSKAAIRKALDSGAVSETQKGAVKRALARGKATDLFTIEKLKDGSIKVTREVAGYSGGAARATYSQIVNSSGTTVPGSVLQLGYDSSGALTHVDPK